MVLLSPEQASVVEALRYFGTPVPAKIVIDHLCDLTENFWAQKTRIEQMLRDLEASGLVAKTRFKRQGRPFAWSLTEAGKAAA